MKFLNKRSDKSVLSRVKGCLSFDEYPENYDRWRPRYVRELFNDVFRYSGIGKGSHVLEIGMGTGQATEPFLEGGCLVTAVEPGENMVRYSRKKFGKFTNLKIENMFFEDYCEKNETFDLIYSATAFHWISEKTGLNKIFDLLRKGGTLALWWNKPSPDRPGDEIYEDIEKVYDKYMEPGNKKGPVDYKLRQMKIGNAITSHGFTGLECRMYHDVRTFNAEDYVGLLNTYSDHKGMKPEVKRLFESGIRQAIQNHGNRLCIRDTMDLYLAKRPVVNL